ncbi:hypothetical protein H6F89_18960 [Cyanobacteria bacterium FACHB-63]|nr:hypothetical protein [Cyanobacteria bacterium FACHB-63]
MKRMGLMLFLLLFVAVACVAFNKLQSRRPGVVSGCPDWVLTQTETATEFVYPDHIVVEPWQGRHNVFATFKVPDGYQPGRFVVVRFEGSSPYCGDVVTHSTANGDRQVTAFFRTRTTLWLMSKGQINQLEQPNNWKLAIFKS